MEHLEAYNRKLLANILPEHVAQHFLCSDKNIDVSAAPAAPRAPGGSRPRLMLLCSRSCTTSSASRCASCSHPSRTSRNFMSSWRATTRAWSACASSTRLSPTSTKSLRRTSSSTLRRSRAPAPRTWPHQVGLASARVRRLPRHIIRLYGG